MNMDISDMQEALTPLGQGVIALHFTALVLISFFLYRRRFLGNGWGFPLAMGANIWALYIFIDRVNRTLLFSSPRRSSGEFRIFMTSLCAAMLIVLGVAFAVRLYAKWTGKALSDEEKTPGVEGVRAWLSGPNVCVALAIALCAWQGYSYSFWTILTLLAGALLVCPAVMTMTAAGPEAAETPAATEGLQDERERVLKLLEDGKITPEECGELLTALGGTLRREPRPAPVTLTPALKFMLLGAALVFAGFLMPWYSLNMGKEVSRFSNQLPGHMGTMAQSMVSQSQAYCGLPAVTARGMDYRTGWIVLLLAALPAALHLIKPNLPPRTLHKCAAAALAIGGIIIIVLMARDMRHIAIGLPVALAGYALAFMGLTKAPRRGEA